MQGNDGGRIRWPPYTKWERSSLEDKFLGDWESLDFLETFWNPIYDRKDLLQYQRAAKVWRLRLEGKRFGDIGKEVGIDQGKACALFGGNNLRPNLVQMYLVGRQLVRPREGWKWVLECTPKPTNAYPRALFVPSEIKSFHDIEDFIGQFPKVQKDHPALKLFGLSVEWVEQHRLELFGFLLGFLIGDAGKYFPEYNKHSRHNAKTSLNTNMKKIDSNTRILTFIQLCLSVIGLRSHAVVPAPGTTRWTSESSNILTWIFRVCVGLKPGERTSRNSVRMEWMLSCPSEFIKAVYQGIAESNGSVNKNGHYAEIASVPNSVFFQRMLASIGTPSRVHPKRRPRQLRVNLEPAVDLPMFNPIINSYRFQIMMNHAKRRGLILPVSPLSR